MKTLLITYDLKKPGQNYSELYDAIKDCGDWRHPLESVWVVKTMGGDDADVRIICDKLRRKMDSNDLLFVVDITKRDCNGWMPESFWDWLQK